MVLDIAPASSVYIIHHIKTVLAAITRWLPVWHSVDVLAKDMKLAEALVSRAAFNTRVEHLNGRIKRNLIVQEGDTPPEDSPTLLAELRALLVQLADLLTRINRTNLLTALPPYASLTAALAQRDMLARRFDLLHMIATAASDRAVRYSQREIRFVTTVDVAALYREVDDIARQRRELDIAIQEANWATELLE
jgi:hypothetical protein